MCGAGPAIIGFSNGHKNCERSVPLPPRAPGGGDIPFGIALRRSVPPASPRGPLSALPGLPRSAGAGSLAWPLRPSDRASGALRSSTLGGFHFGQGYRPLHPITVPYRLLERALRAHQPAPARYASLGLIHGLFGFNARCHAARRTTASARHPLNLAIASETASDGTEPRRRGQATRSESALNLATVGDGIEAPRFK